MRGRAGEVAFAPALHVTINEQGAHGAGITPHIRSLVVRLLKNVGGVGHILREEGSRIWGEISAEDIAVGEMATLLRNTTTVGKTTKKRQCNTAFDYIWRPNG